MVAKQHILQCEYRDLLSHTQTQIVKRNSEKKGFCVASHGF